MRSSRLLERRFRYTVTWCIAAALPFFTLAGVGADIPISYRSRHWTPSSRFFSLSVGLFVCLCLSWRRTTVTIHEEGISYKSPFRQRIFVGTKSLETRYGQQPHQRCGRILGSLDG